MRAAVQKVEKRDYTWIIVLVLIAVPLTLEFLVGEDLYNKLIIKELTQTDLPAPVDPAINR